MLQRIQTIYLAIVFIIVAVLPYVLPLWKLDGKDYMFNKEMLYVILFGLSTLC